MDAGYKHMVIQGVSVNLGSKNYQKQVSLLQQ